jgi:hypothetical protein
MAAGLYAAGFRTCRPDLVTASRSAVLEDGVVVMAGFSFASAGDDRPEVLSMSLSSSSSSSSSSSEACPLVRLRLPPALRGAVECFIFLIGLVSEDAETLDAAGLAGACFDKPVSPAVTFRMALMPAVALPGFGAVGFGADGAETVDGVDRTGAVLGIWMVIWVDMFMPMTSRRLTSS